MILTTLDVYDNSVRGQFILKLRRLSMVCNECKDCWNYMECENGCYGSDKPCESLVTDTDN